jgi:hypothetical protein
MVLAHGLVSWAATGAAADIPGHSTGGPDMYRGDRRISASRPEIAGKSGDATAPWAVCAGRAPAKSPLAWDNFYFMF